MSPGAKVNVESLIARDWHSNCNKMIQEQVREEDKRMPWAEAAASAVKSPWFVERRVSVRFDMIDKREPRVTCLVRAYAVTVVR